MPRQFVSVKFRPGDTRSFTYVNDGDPVAIGDEVKVPDRHGDGWNRVTVCDLPPGPPNNFPVEKLKAILGRVEPEAPKPAAAATAPPAGVKTVDDLFAPHHRKPKSPFPDDAPEDDLRNHL